MYIVVVKLASLTGISISVALAVFIVLFVLGLAERHNSKRASAVENESMRKHVNRVGQYDGDKDVS